MITLEFERGIGELESKIAELRHLSSDGGINIASEVEKLETKLARQLRQTWNLGLEHISDNCERAWRELYAAGEPSAARRDRDWLYARGPFCLGHRWDGTLLLLPRRADADEPTMVRLWRAGGAQRRPLVDLLRDEVDQVLLLSESARLAIGANGEAAVQSVTPKVIPLAAQRFEPRLVRRPDDDDGDAPRGRARRVRHATFGDGTVVAPPGREATRDDQHKLAVRFDDGETRVLLARYVHYLD